ncbi:hypothetical protein [Clostridium kluyveri]|nr:hypothetical protein [Clostridium kluyveri]
MIDEQVAETENQLNDLLEAHSKTYVLDDYTISLIIRAFKD